MYACVMYMHVHSFDVLSSHSFSCKLRSSGIHECALQIQRASCIKGSASINFKSCCFFFIIQYAGSRSTVPYFFVLFSFYFSYIMRFAVKLNQSNMAHISAIAC